ncbi:glycosyltransferase family 25 protein [Helicobacter salomonis]|uniref:glycosyltransferase family 25 protein n=1 Tax=Helicobacter salomonis TaxID=56878 RepID=UPI0013151A48|nr:glycosyltransferase family 25 protein [Helicobacter salomonis]
MEERNIAPLLRALNNPRHPVEIFEAIYATRERWHPMVKDHVHPYFLHTHKTLKMLDSWSAGYYALKFLGKSMSIGELGCYASHYALWRRCVALQEPICVLEDDVGLQSNFFENLDFLEKEISNLGYARLMCLNYAQWEAVNMYPQIAEKVGLTWGEGTQGYVITPSVAHKFLSVSAGKWVMPIDWIMDNHYLHGVRNLVLNPLVYSYKISLAISIVLTIDSIHFWCVVVARSTLSLCVCTHAACATALTDL